MINIHKSIVLLRVKMCPFIVLIEYAEKYDENKHIMAVLWFTSTSFITGTGLKKWIPPNLSSLLVELAISVMGREDVLLAKMVCLKHTVHKLDRIYGTGMAIHKRRTLFSHWLVIYHKRDSAYSGATISSRPKRSCLILRFSTMASTTRSEPWTTDAASVEVDTLRRTFWRNSSPALNKQNAASHISITRFTLSLISSGGLLGLTCGLSANFFLTTLLRLPSIPLMDFLRMSSFVSTSVTEWPVDAAT